MARLWKNNAYSNLASGLTDVDTTLIVTTGHGDRFPVVANPDTCNLTLQDASGNIEVVRVTARTSGADTMTVVRAQEGTSARTWAMNDAVELRVTAAAHTAYEGHINAPSGAHVASAIGSTPAGNLSATNVQAALNELDTEKADAGHTHTASAITNTPAGNIAATNVQAAINELDSEKAAVGHTHTGTYAAAGAATASGLTAAVGKLLQGTGTGLGEVDGVSALIGAASFSGVITPAQITASQNDYSPTGWDAASCMRLSSDASRNITGIAGGTAGRFAILINGGSFDIVLKNEDGASTAGNRFTLGADVTLSAGKTAVLHYDATSARWRPLAVPPAAASGLIAVTTFTGNGTWNKSTNNPSKIVVMAVGGGGAGGGAPAGNAGFGTGGVAGAVNWAYTASPATSYAVTIGAGGTGVSGTNGNNGSNTSVGALLTAAGGQGGVAISVGGTYLLAHTGEAGQSCLGVGGARQTAGGSNGNAASANTGAGGGGSKGIDSGAATTGGAGGSGLVIIWEFA